MQKIIATIMKENSYFIGQTDRAETDTTFFIGGQSGGGSFLGLGIRNHVRYIHRNLCKQRFRLLLQGQDLVHRVLLLSSKGRSRRGSSFKRSLLLLQCLSASAQLRWFSGTINTLALFGSTAPGFWSGSLYFRLHVDLA